MSSRPARGASFVELSLLLVAFVVAGGAAYRVVGKTCAARTNGAATTVSVTHEEETTAGVLPHDPDRE